MPQPTAGMVSTASFSFLRNTSERVNTTRICCVYKNNWDHFELAHRGQP
jgi:hypothetical protein